MNGNTRRQNVKGQKGKGRRVVKRQGGWGGMKLLKDKGGEGVWGENAVIGGELDSEGGRARENKNEIVRRRKGYVRNEVIKRQGKGRRGRVVRR